MSEALLWGPEADEFVRQLEAQGVTLRLRGERLVLEGPAEVLTDDLLRELRSRKLDLAAHLRGENVRGVRLLEGGAVGIAKPLAELRQEQAITE